MIITASYLRLLCNVAIQSVLRTLVVTRHVLSNYLIVTTAGKVSFCFSCICFFVLMFVMVSEITQK